MINSINSVKINKPLEYSGDRTLTKAFIAQNELVFRSQPDSFQQDSQKITYLASLREMISINRIIIKEY